MVKAIIKFLIYLQTINAYTLPKEKSCQDCYYGITRNNENEYLMLKNTLRFLLENHENITLDLVNNLDHSSVVKTCDSGAEYVCIKQVIQKDFRHPSHLFKNIQVNSSNNVYKQYEDDWYKKYKYMDTQRHDTSYKEICNRLGLKLYCLLHDYKPTSKISYCRTTSNNQDEIASILVDHFIAQSLMKNCYGNLEMLVRGLNKILKFDCDRAYSSKVAYFSSKYLNFIRTCDSESNLNDLVTTLPTNCTNNMRNFRNKRLCVWFEAVCKYPLMCLKSKNWTNT